MINYEDLIDYKLIKDKKTFNQLLEQRESGINVKIDFELFNIDSCYKKEYINIVEQYEKLLEKTLDKGTENVKDLLFNIKEYIAVRNLLIENKKIETSQYVYRLF